MTTFHERTFHLHVPITLRIATREDLPKLEWYGQYTHFRAVLRRTFRDQQLGKRLMIVADCRDFPIGQIFMQLRSEDAFLAQERFRAYLYSFRVMDMFRGMGIGTQLLNEAEATAQSLGYQWTTIAVAKDNPAARRLYERNGYQVFASDEGQWSYTDHQGVVQFVHEPCWLLEKRIKPS